MPNMMTRRITAQDVNDPRSFAEYAQTFLGTPYPTGQHMGKLIKDCREAMEAEPRLTWHMLTRVVDWCRAKKFRAAQPYTVLKMIRHAWADGYLPELDPAEDDANLSARIERILDTETDQRWRDLLVRAQGPKQQLHAVEMWESSHR